MSTTVSQPVISLEAARAVIDRCIVEASALGVAVAIEVVDPGGNPVAMVRMDHSPLLSRQIAADKAWTAVSFGQSTSWWTDLVASEPSLSALGKGNRLMPVPGGVPIVSSESIIGGVGVSGATAEQDHQIAAVGASHVKEA